VVFGQTGLVIELHGFYNDGMGWVCRHCEQESREAAETSDTLSRMFREGEAESKNPVLSSRALAKWTDKTRRQLVCPRCGISELVDNS
jgi:hypothetical protein